MDKSASDDGSLRALGVQDEAFVVVLRLASKVYEAFARLGLLEDVYGCMSSSKTGERVEFYAGWPGLVSI